MTHTSFTRTFLLGSVMFAVSCRPAPSTVESVAAQARGGTQVVFLGTGTPLPDPDRSGPATAVVVDGAAYLFDAGAGVVRRASLGVRKGIAALNAVNLKTAFLTHLHSDHTMGLPDLMLTPWTMGRTEPLELYGPVGTRAMTDGIQKAWALDIDRRLHDLQPSTPHGWQVNVHEIQGGQIYRDERVTVTAIPVLHGAWEAFAFRIQTRDRTIVISGDARPSADLAKACQKCDLLIFEVYTMGSTEKVTPPWREYRRAYHTSTKELGEIATLSQPGLLVLYHRANPGCDQAGTDCGTSGSEAEALDEMHRFYAGRVVEAHDLDVF
jgi:ribonuclease BN (tRNA processing enzyme)